MKATRRSLFFPPGMISLSILPFLCFCVFYQIELRRLSQHVLEVTHWDERDTAFDPRRLVNDKFIKITLTGEGDAVKLSYFRDAVKQLLQRQDTTGGVEVVLGRGAKYASLVKLYDICEREGAHQYLHLLDTGWVFSLAPAFIEALISVRYAQPGNSEYT